MKIIKIINRKIVILLFLFLPFVSFCKEIKISNKRPNPVCTRLYWNCKDFTWYFVTHYLQILIVFCVIRAAAQKIDKKIENKTDECGVIRGLLYKGLQEIILSPIGKVYGCCESFVYTPLEIFCYPLFKTFNTKLLTEFEEKTTEKLEKHIQGVNNLQKLVEELQLVNNEIIDKNNEFTTYVNKSINELEASFKLLNDSMSKMDSTLGNIEKKQSENIENIETIEKSFSDQVSNLNQNFKNYQEQYEKYVQNNEKFREEFIVCNKSIIDLKENLDQIIKTNNSILNQYNQEKSHMYKKLFYNDIRTILYVGLTIGMCSSNNNPILQKKNTKKIKYYNHSCLCNDTCVKD